MKHVEECLMREHHYVGDPKPICICERLLKAGARGYKSGYDDAYFDGYNDGYDSALSHRACFNQHGTGENP
jgi:hypothetical protein